MSVIIYPTAAQVLRVRNCACCCDQPSIPPDCPACKGAGGFGPYPGGPVVILTVPAPQPVTKAPVPADREGGR